MVVTTRLVRLPKGGRAIKVRVRALLTRYDLVASAIRARREDEPELTKGVIRRYLCTIMVENGVEGFISIYNNATKRQVDEADQLIFQLFPRL